MNSTVEFLFKNVGYGLPGRSGRGFAAAHWWNYISRQSNPLLCTISVLLGQGQNCPIRDMFLNRETIVGQCDSAKNVVARRKK